MTDAERWLREHRAEAHWAKGQVGVFAGSLWGVGRDLAEAVRNAQVNEFAGVCEPVAEGGLAWRN